MDILEEYKNDLLLYFKDMSEFKNLTFPSDLFKYCNFNENNCQKLHLQNLDNDCVWLNPASKFNDPYDSVFCIDKYIFNKLGRKFVEQEKEAFQKSNKVASFSASPTETSLLMWGHYAHNHEGFCIKYNFKEIIMQIDNSSWERDERPLLYPVIYRDKLLNITERIKYPDNKFKAIQLSIIKYIQWKYEEEWRLVAVGKATDNGRLFPMPNPSAIYLGAKIEIDNKKRIAKIALEKNILVYEMLFSDTDEYRLHPKVLKKKDLRHIVASDSEQQIS